jgi:cyanophycinase
MTGRTTGAIGLHGGAEFTAGDEPYLLALLETAGGHDDRGGSAVRVVVVPTAAARHRPQATGQHGRDAFERVAANARIPLRVDVALIVDAESANDPEIAALLAEAGVIYFPGGDPDLLPNVMPESAAWKSILAAHERGAVIAGASAGAMALAPRTWTPGGWLAGLGLVHGLVVVPHFNGFDRRGWEGTLAQLNAAGLGYLGIDERTGVLSNGHDGSGWRVVGPGRVEWGPADGERVTGTSGATIPLPA